MLFDECEARDCPYIWGSAFSITSMTPSSGSVVLSNCSAKNMPGAGLAIYTPTPVGGDLGTSLTVRDFTATNVAKEYGRMLTGKEVAQSFSPITLGAQSLIPNRIELRNVTIDGVAHVSAGQRFIGWSVPPPAFLSSLLASRVSCFLYWCC